ncbi:MAG: hypothetical protein N3A72_11320 [bacterium]|nr:hypothetical protein [bacterium]
MPSEQFDIEITKSGEVVVRFKDIAGTHVVEYVNVLTKMIGTLKEDQVNIKRYEPEPEIGITPSATQSIHRKV